MNRSLLSFSRSSFPLNLIPYRTKTHTWLKYKENKNFIPQLNANDIGEHQGSPHVQERFFRLGWGGYIHPQKQRRLFTYKKPDEQNQREDMHVMAANRRLKFSIKCVIINIKNVFILLIQNIKSMIHINVVGI